MPRYKYVGDLPAFIPDVPIEVQPGEEFDSAVELNSPSIVDVNSKKSAPAPVSAPPAEEVQA